MKKTNAIYQVAAVRRARQTAPLRELEWDPMRRVVSLLEAAEGRGDWPRLQWLTRTVERRWALLGALVARRVGAVGRMPWRVRALEDSAVAALAAQRLGEAYGRLEVGAVVRHLCMATFRGYAHVEVVGDGQGGVARLQPVPQWHFAREGADGPWRYLPEPDRTDLGLELEPGRWFVREVERPVNTVALMAFVRHGLGRKDWDAWVETYGIPPLVVELPPDVPSDQLEKYQEMAEAIVGDLRGTMPSGAKVHNIGSDTRQSQPFGDYLAGIEREVVLAATGGLLTMLNEATGLGSGQSAAHQDAFESLAANEAAEIAALIAGELDERLSGDSEGRARFCIEWEDVDDLDALADRVLKLSQAGFQADAGELSERLGLTLKAGVAAGSEALRAARPASGADGLPDLSAWRRRLEHEATRGMLAAARS